MLAVRGLRTSFPTDAGLVTAVDGVMIYDALSTFGGDTPDAYRTGLLYNQRIAEERRQDELGWTESTNFDNATGVFSVTLKDRDGRGVEDLQIAATVGRPATDIADHKLVLAAAGGGVYSAVVPNLAEGTWDVSLVASQGDAANREGQDAQGQGPCDTSQPGDAIVAEPGVD